MKYNSIIAIQEQSKQFTAQTAEEAANYGKNILFESVAKSPLYILKNFWPILLIFLLAFIIKILSQEKKRKEYRREKKNLKWKKQPPIK